MLGCEDEGVRFPDLSRLGSDQKRGEIPGGIRRRRNEKVEGGGRGANHFYDLECPWPRGTIQFDSEEERARASALFLEPSPPTTTSQSVVFARGESASATAVRLRCVWCGQLDVVLQETQQGRMYLGV